MTRILTVLTPRVRKMHFRVRCINLHIKCPSFSSRYLAACVVSLRQLWGGSRMSGLEEQSTSSDIHLIHKRSDINFNKFRPYKRFKSHKARITK